MNSVAALLHRPHLGAGTSLLVSNIAGILHKTVNLPLDVISTRQQTARDGSGLWQNYRSVVEARGVRGLWDGLGPTLLLTSNPAITYTVFDVAKSLLLSHGRRCVRIVL